MTNFGVDARYVSVQNASVLDTDELLERLEARGVRNIDIARVLGLPDSRVPEIKTKRRALKLDEGVKLARAFQLESAPPPQPLSIQVVRLLVRYIADHLQSGLEDSQLQELSEDVRAFAQFVADPKVRSSEQMAEGFFQAMRLRRPERPTRGRRESDPSPIR